MKKRIIALLGTLLITAILVHAQAPIRVMILDGESAGTFHRWDLATPVIQKILEEPAKFKVDVVTAPPKDGDFTNFMPKFSDYQVVILNYDAPVERWPDALKKSFEQFVSNGGGLVTIHGADNAFNGWAEYNKMIGIGGWRGRNEQSGPYWYYQSGKLTSDVTAGNAGAHGNRLPFLMKVTDPNHPITKGLPSTWMHQGDELYGRLRGPGENMNVLVTAYSDPANKGSGFEEPQLMVINYGKGRVFHYTPGHDVVAMSSVDYVVLLQRGTEWAATGKVNQKVPADFPTANTITYRADIAKMDPNYVYGFNGPPRTPAPARPATPPAEVK